MGEGRGMEIGRRTLFRTCEITWASKRFAVQGHLERGGFILMNLYSSARPGTKGTPRKKVVSADCNEEVLISSLGVVPMVYATRRYRNFAPFVRQTGERKAQTCAMGMLQQLR